VWSFSYIIFSNFLSLPSCYVQTFFWTLPSHISSLLSLTVDDIVPCPCRKQNKQPNSVAFNPQANYTEPPLVGEISCQILQIEGCRVVSTVDPPWSLISFSRPEPLLFFQVAPHLCSRGWVDPVPDPLLCRKSGSTGNRTGDLWVCSQELWPLDHRGGIHGYANQGENGDLYT
jgi:hypothetical protein